jgi:hypothetical protein
MKGLMFEIKEPKQKLRAALRKMYTENPGFSPEAHIAAAAMVVAAEGIFETVKLDGATLTIEPGEEGCAIKSKGGICVPQEVFDEAIEQTSRDLLKMLLADVISTGLGAGIIALADTNTSH